MKCIGQSCFSVFGQVQGNLEDLVCSRELEMLLLRNTAVEGEVLRNRIIRIAAVDLDYRTQGMNELVNARVRDQNLLPGLDACRHVCICIEICGICMHFVIAPTFKHVQTLLHNKCLSYVSDHSTYCQLYHKRTSAHPDSALTRDQFW